MGAQGGTRRAEPAPTSLRRSRTGRWRSRPGRASTSHGRRPAGPRSTAGPAQSRRRRRSAS
eukprot:1736869-Alexandrium_andersonii.AAC.1